MRPYQISRKQASTARALKPMSKQVFCKLQSGLDSCMVKRLVSCPRKQKRPLIQVEGNLLKKAIAFLVSRIGVSKCSYSTELYHSVGISTLEYAIRKRRISFILQLLNNPVTKRILETDAESRKQILRDFSHDIVNSSTLEETAIRNGCTAKLAALKEESSKHDPSRFTIKNRITNRDNKNGLLEFFLHKKYSFRDHTAG